ncbi:hypothetical protein DAETH_12160 [Deinococcus aetherius]|uniref:DUF6745 domain-containing protein n=1 Tax=Deinococcus aetherius TaxID=200252 RepID=A0ABM8ACC5_9DEIO|nr:hypothetical protein [Deinococcus aetherius]BDP41247.1 hypothetical protein DAETH_12160 [Deinococcus aetherius]
MFRVGSGGRLISAPRREGPGEERVEVKVQPVPTTSPSHAPGTAPTVTPDQARTLLRRGPVPPALHVTGPLNLGGSTWLRALPEWLRCTSLNVEGCPNLSALPTDLQSDSLNARNTTSLHEVDGRWSVRDGVDLSGSGVRTLNADLRASRLTLGNCRALTRLEGRISVGHLDVSGCASLTTLGADLHVTGSLELADSGLTALPPGLRVRLQWRGVPVDARVAFRPDTIAGREVLLTRNVQRRRVLLDRIGVERFLAEVGGLILDRDRDAGGERQLVRVPFDDDEPLVAVLVRCPSTGGRYALRVPPHIHTCAGAVAWTAGLDPGEYHPLREA